MSENASLTKTSSHHEQVLSHMFAAFSTNSFSGHVTATTRAPFIVESLLEAIRLLISSRCMNGVVGASSAFTTSRVQTGRVEILPEFGLFDGDHFHILH